MKKFAEVEALLGIARNKPNLKNRVDEAKIYVISDFAINNSADGQF